VAEELAKMQSPVALRRHLTWYDLELYNYGRIAYV
jgi:hypothetical protein